MRWSSEFLLPFLLSATVHMGVLVHGPVHRVALVPEPETPARVVLNIVPALPDQGAEAGVAARSDTDGADRGAGPAAAPRALRSSEAGRSAARPSRNASAPEPSHLARAPEVPASDPVPPAEQAAGREAPEPPGGSAEAAKQEPSRDEVRAPTLVADSAGARALAGWGDGEDTGASVGTPASGGRSGNGGNGDGSSGPGGGSAAIGGAGGSATGSPARRQSRPPPPPTTRAAPAPRSAPERSPTEPSAPVRSSPTARRSSNGEGDAVGGPTVGARLVGVSKPKYPTLSRRSGEEGTVLLSVEIHPDGTHGAIRMVRSSGHWRLDQAAARALERATFIPAKNDGKPVASRKQIAFIFRLVDAED